MIIRKIGLSESAIIGSAVILLSLLYIRVLNPDMLEKYPLLSPLLSLLMGLILIFFALTEFFRLHDKKDDIIDLISSLIRVPLYLIGGVFVIYIGYLDFLKIP